MTPSVNKLIKAVETQIEDLKTSHKTNCEIIEAKEEENVKIAEELNDCFNALYDLKRIKESREGEQ